MIKKGHKMEILNETTRAQVVAVGIRPEDGLIQASGEANGVDWF